jgi:Ca2+-binding RTX toxin-like protein
MNVTIDLSSLGDGIYVIEDDGIVGNNTSRLVGPNGFSQSLTNSDSLNILSRAGQHLIIDPVDPFTGILSVGDRAGLIAQFTNPATWPSSIQIGSFTDTSSVYLATTGAISELGSDDAIDITAHNLFMLAGTGIGSTDTLETAIARVGNDFNTGVLQAETGAGNIDIVNVGNVTIGGPGQDFVRGLSAAGNVSLLNQGSILLIEETGPSAVFGGGDVTLHAIGPEADLISFFDINVIRAGGNVNLAAGRDLTFDSGPGFNNDVRAGGSILVSVGRDFRLGGSADMIADALGVAGNDGVSISAGRSIQLDGAASVGVAGSGAVALVTGPGGTVTFTSTAASALFAGADGVAVRADRMLLDGRIAASNGGTVALIPSSPGRPTFVGAGTDGVFALELSDAELDRVSAVHLIVGSGEAGPLSVSGSVTLATGELTLRSGANLTIGADVSGPSVVNLLTAANLRQLAGTTITTGSLTAAVDTPDTDSAGGVLTLDGALAVTANFLDGNADADTINGSAEANTLLGLGGNDRLDGRRGADTTDGGAGDDWHVVDDAGDMVVERIGEGSDRVLASASYQLNAGAEVELLTAADQAGLAALDLTGNEFGQIIYGNEGANRLAGGGGSDRLWGLGGDDVYVVDGSAVIVEAAGAGNDRVEATASYSLNAGAAVELLTAADQTAVTALDIAGNEFGQVIIGNEGANALEGGGGNDTLQGIGGNDYLDGGAGNDVTQGDDGDDTHVVDSAGDQVIEFAGGGFDRVLTSVSYTLGDFSDIELLSARDQGGSLALTLIGNGLANNIQGNEGDNILAGGAGNDTLYGLGGSDALNGGAGSDLLIGGTGGDGLIFTAPLVQGEADLILGFVSGEDRIFLDDAAFAGLALGALPAEAFRAGPSAQDGDDRILYDAVTGALYFDADGNGAGAAIHFATLIDAPPINAGDFMVI